MEIKDDLISEYKIAFDYIRTELNIITFLTTTHVAGLGFILQGRVSIFVDAAIRNTPIKNDDIVSNFVFFMFSMFISWLFSIAITIHSLAIQRIRRHAFKIEKKIGFSIISTTKPRNYESFFEYTLGFLSVLISLVLTVLTCILFVLLLK